MSAAVFLDRDGVIVEEIYYPETGETEAPMRPEDVRLLPGAAAALRLLSDAGFRLILLSNQAAHAKGKIDLRSLWLAHERFVTLLAEEKVLLDAEYYSFTHPDGIVPHFSGASLERKPSPTNLLVAAARFDLDLGRSWMIGDRETDVACGRSAGVRGIRIAKPTVADATVGSVAGFLADDLSAAARIVLREVGPNTRLDRDPMDAAESGKFVRG